MQSHSEKDSLYSNCKCVEVANIVRKQLICILKSQNMLNKSLEKRTVKVLYVFYRKLMKPDGQYTLLSV